MNSAVMWSDDVEGHRVGVLHRQVDSATVTTNLAQRDRSCMLVHDPENKARYLVQAGLCEDTMGYKDYGAKKQSFLCMLFQKGGCRAKGACNQIHLSQRVVKGARRFASSLTGAYTVEKKDNFVAELTVLDCETKKQVTIPYHLTHATLGRGAASKGGVVEICKYYLSPSGCRYASGCRSIHVKPAYKAIQSAPCCPMHGESQGLTTDPKMRISILSHTGSPITVPLALVTPTKGLERFLLKQGPSAKSCIHHQQARCVHGPLCNNIHMCRQYGTGGCAPVTPTKAPLGLSFRPVPSCSSIGSIVSSETDEATDEVHDDDDEFADLPQLMEGLELF